MNTDSQTAQCSEKGRSAQLNDSDETQAETLINTQLMCKVHSNAELTTIAIKDAQLSLQCYKCMQENNRNQQHNGSIYFDLKEVLTDPLNFAIDRTRTPYNQLHLLQDYLLVKTVDIDELCDNFLINCEQLILSFKESTKLINSNIVSFQEQIMKVHQEVFKICQHDNFITKYEHILQQNPPSQIQQLEKALFNQYENVNFQCSNMIYSKVMEVNYQIMAPNNQILELQSSINQYINGLVTKVQETTQKGYISQILLKETQSRIQLYCGDNLKLVYMSQRDGLDYPQLVKNIEISTSYKQSVLLILSQGFLYPKFGFIIDNYKQLSVFRESNYAMIRLLQQFTINKSPNNRSYLNFGGMFRLDDEFNFKEEGVQEVTGCLSKYWILYNNSLTQIYSGKIIKIEMYTF